MQKSLTRELYGKFQQIDAGRDRAPRRIMEELGEAGQAVGKILRHGYENKNPFCPEEGTNREKLERELGDVNHAILRLCESRDISHVMVKAHSDTKRSNIEPYLHHQPPDPRTCKHSWDLDTACCVKCGIDGWTT